MSFLEELRMGNVSILCTCGGTIMKSHSGAHTCSECDFYHEDNQDQEQGEDDEVV